MMRKSSNCTFQSRTEEKFLRVTLEKGLSKIDLKVPRLKNGFNIPTSIKPPLSLT